MQWLKVDALYWFRYWCGILCYLYWFRYCGILCCLYWFRYCCGILCYHFVWALMWHFMLPVIIEYWGGVYYLYWQRIDMVNVCYMCQLKVNLLVCATCIDCMCCIILCCYIDWVWCSRHKLIKSCYFYLIYSSY